MQDILGGIHNESIQVLAEAYDVALDVSFQKGMGLIPRGEGRRWWGIHNESIEVLAEAYNVSLDVSFQKGRELIPRGEGRGKGGKMGGGSVCVGGASTTRVSRCWPRLMMSIWMSASRKVRD